MKPCLGGCRGQAVFLTFIWEGNPFLRLGEKALVGKDVWEGTHKLTNVYDLSDGSRPKAGR